MSAYVLVAVFAFASPGGAWAATMNANGVTSVAIDMPSEAACERAAKQISGDSGGSKIVQTLLSFQDFLEDGSRMSEVPPNLVHTAMLAMLNTAITAQIGAMIEVQVPANDVMNVLCEHLGKLLSLIEPEQLRNSILGEIRRNLPAVMNRHFEARMTTPGGIRLPQPANRVN